MVVEADIWNENIFRFLNRDEVIGQSFVRLRNVSFGRRGNKRSEP